jgi:hypothetical protein
MLLGPLTQGDIQQVHRWDPSLTRKALHPSRVLCVALQYGDSAPGVVSGLERIVLFHRSDLSITSIGFVSSAPLPEATYPAVFRAMAAECSARPACRSDPHRVRCSWSFLSQVGRVRKTQTRKVTLILMARDSNDCRIGEAPHGIDGPRCVAYGRSLARRAIPGRPSNLPPGDRLTPSGTPNARLLLS